MVKQIADEFGRLDVLVNNAGITRDTSLKKMTDEQWEGLSNPVAIELEAGECSFHHPLMIHGSFENRTNGPRRATVINAFRDGVRSASDEPLLDGVRGLG